MTCYRFRIDIDLNFSMLVESLNPQYRLLRNDDVIQGCRSIIVLDHTR